MQNILKSRNPEIQKFNFLKIGKSGCCDTSGSLLALFVFNIRGSTLSVTEKDWAVF